LDVNGYEQDLLVRGRVFTSASLTADTDEYNIQSSFRQNGNVLNKGRFQAGYFYRPSCTDNWPSHIYTGITDSIPFRHQQINTQCLWPTLKQTDHSLSKLLYKRIETAWPVTKLTRIGFALVDLGEVLWRIIIVEQLALQASLVCLIRDTSCTLSTLFTTSICHWTCAHRYHLRRLFCGTYRRTIGCFHRHVSV
jgi:hypothetical protein